MKAQGKILQPFCVHTQMLQEIWDLAITKKIISCGTQHQHKEFNVDVMKLLLLQLYIKPLRKTFREGDGHGWISSSAYIPYMPLPMKTE